MHMQERSGYAKSLSILHHARLEDPRCSLLVLELSVGIALPRDLWQHGDDGRGGKGTRKGGSPVHYLDRSRDLSILQRNNLAGQLFTTRTD